VKPLEMIINWRSRQLSTVSIRFFD